MNVLTSIAGYLTIYGNSHLENLTGLESLSFIGEGLVIGQNDILTSLSGLENLATVNNGGLYIGYYVAGGGNPSLSDISDLSNLSTIEGGLFINLNTVLQSLDGLDSLSSINGSLEIRWNTLLNNISGLNNVDPGSISDLMVANNSALSNCDIESFCSYLLMPNAAVNIYNNASGCNSQPEVMDSCMITTVNELTGDAIFTISPNPLESTTMIQYKLQSNSNVTLKILDLTGQEITTLVDNLHQQGEQKVLFNTTSLPAGIYFCVLKINEGIQTTKLIKL